ncbi:MAG: ArnT family glycosyltransferase [Thermoanaerobaculia bacterium]
MSRAKRNHQEPAAGPVSPPPYRGAALIIAGLSIVAFVVLAFGNIRSTSPVFDETVHLAAGYRYLTAHDYRLNPEHPPLLKMLAAIPLRSMSIWPDDGRRAAEGSMTLPLLNEAWAMAVANPKAEWFYAPLLLYAIRDSTLRRLGDAPGHVPPEAALSPGDYLNDSAAMFTRARSAMLLTGILLALAIFLWSYEVWGPWAAAFSTMLFCFDPNIIANSSLVTTDAGVSLMMFVSVWLFWRVCRKFSWLNVAAFAICFGFAQGTKFSALLLAPVVIVIALVHGRRQLPRITIAIAIATLTAYAAIWAVYGFRYSMVPDPQRAEASEAMARSSLAQQELDVPPSDGHPPMGVILKNAAVKRALFETWPEGAPRSAVIRAWESTPIGFTGNAILFGARFHLLPEAYLYGLAYLRGSTFNRNSFLRGAYSATGFRDYFFWTFLYKTPLPSIAAILIALIGIFRKRPEGLLPFLLWPIAIYLVISVSSNFNIGHRHILPVYPLLYVLCGSLAPRWERLASLSQAVTAVVTIALVVTASLFVFACAPSPMWSRHLSYMNELAGGPERGFTRLADSNFDWGQDLPRLGSWLREHHVNDPIDFVYTGTSDPRFYGIRYHNLAATNFGLPQPWADGGRRSEFFAIGATAYEGVPFVAGSHDIWRSYLAKSGATLVGKAGYTMFIYRIDKRKLPPL